MARTSLHSLLLSLLVYTTIMATVSANANPFPAPTPVTEMANIAARQETTAPLVTVSPITTICTSTGFNSANEITTTSGECVVELCSTPTVGLDGRPSTSTGTCTLTPIGGDAVRPTPPMGMAKMGAMAGAVGMLGVGMGMGGDYGAM